MKQILMAFLLLLFTTTNALAADGWGAGATGGSGGTSVTVTTASAFKTYATSSSKYIITVSGSISVGSVSLASNKTIKGANTSAKLTGELVISGKSNIIIQNLTIKGGKHCVDILSGASKIFITKCTLYDGTDELVSVTKAADYVTVSWCKFYYSSSSADHRFSNLIGADDGDTGDSGHLRVTFHHNWWSTNCDERMPRVRFGKVHVYNNYYSASGNSYCVGVGKSANIRLESNYFEGVNNPWKKYGDGIINFNSKPQVFVNSTKPTWATSSSSVFTPSYSYTLDTASNVKSKVKAGAGNI